MQPPILEFEGTAEDIQKRLAEFAGQRLHVTIHPIEASPGDPESHKVPNPDSNGVTLRPIGLCEGLFYRSRIILRSAPSRPPNGI